jgi:hypothetical protein
MTTLAHSADPQGPHGACDQACGAREVPGREDHLPPQPLGCAALLLLLLLLLLPLPLPLLLPLRRRRRRSARASASAAVCAPARERSCMRQHPKQATPKLLRAGAAAAHALCSATHPPTHPPHTNTHTHADARNAHRPLCDWRPSRRRRPHWAQDHHRHVRRLGRARRRRLQRQGARGAGRRHMRLCVRVLLWLRPWACWWGRSRRRAPRLRAPSAPWPNTSTPHTPHPASHVTRVTRATHACRARRTPPRWTARARTLRARRPSLLWPLASRAAAWCRCARVRRCLPACLPAAHAASQHAASGGPARPGVDEELQPQCWRRA